MSRARQRRRAAAWRRYVACNDTLVAHQPHTFGLLHPVRINKGYFRRAEGWRIWPNRWFELRHGA